MNAKKYVETIKGETVADLDFEFPKTIDLPAILVDETDRRFRQLIYNFGVYFNVIETMRKTFARRLGLKRSGYNVLMVIAQYQDTDGVSASEVAKLLRVSHPFVAAESQKLIDLDLVQKRPHPTDGRSNLLSLTNKGESEVMRVVPLIRSVNNKLFKSISRDEFQQFCDTFDTLIKNGERTQMQLAHMVALFIDENEGAAGTASRDPGKKKNVAEKLRK